MRVDRAERKVSRNGKKRGREREKEILAMRRWWKVRTQRDKKNEYEENIKSRHCTGE